MTDEPIIADAWHSQAEQSRINGANSRGPTSEAGKKRVARNARWHGLSSASEVCLESEDRVAFNRLHEGLLNTFSPVCDDGCQLVRQMALATLHQERCARREAAIWEDIELNPALRLRELNLLLRYRNASVRQYFKARRELMEVLRHPHLGTSMLGGHAERIPMAGDEPLTAEHDAIVEADEAAREAHISAMVELELGGPKPAPKPANDAGSASPKPVASQPARPAPAAPQAVGPVVPPRPAAPAPMAPSHYPGQTPPAITDATLKQMATIARLLEKLK